ncbi:uncharacterized protein LOC102345720 isoform X2 [Latimeria chalumnae]|uniref:uncharacterized protein LOC102345720 isoform X2 n=1 Tax=Latimeria chalumnae TaxID=7897 RepID=UPI0006D91829|nr:PREDICTED: uncharacterized protein LOC102345720 isoform X2 [Latimeria chalumnae]|eukprot:XP_014340773.1 PREDICTED: uncharacterized protein LOC102345720 isoform X2 [Latimeria chalumnae]
MGSAEKEGMKALLWLLSVIMLLTLSENLQVTMNSKPLFVLKNEGALLKCIISDFSGPELDLSIVGVRWELKRQGTSEEIYLFSGGEVKKQEPFLSEIPKEELKKGNASIYLLSAQFSEEGTYSCTVFVTPSKAEGTCYLTVSAKPKILLTPQELTIEVGTEKSVLCEVKGFYPQKIDVRWSTSSGAVIVKDICTGAPAKNADETYTIASRLRLQPSLDDNGKTYQCIIAHRTFQEPVKEDCKLTVTEPEVPTSSGAIVGGLLGGVIGTAVVLGVGFFVYNKYFKKVPPKLTEITMPPTLKHLEEAYLSCLITGFRPKNICVVFFLKKKSEDIKAIFCWKTEDSLNRKEPQNSDIPKEEVHILLSKEMENCELDKAFTFPDPKLESNSDGTFNVTWKFSVFPDIYKHDGAVLSVQVYHEDFKPLEKVVKLKVIGVPPRMSQIVVPPRVIHSELLALTCPINGFKPRPLTIVWCKRYQDGREVQIVKLDSQNKQEVSRPSGSKSSYSHSISESEYEDHTFSITSVLIFIPTVNEDHEASFICKVFHDATKYKENKEATLDVKAAPKIDPIQYSPDIPFADRDLTLSCRIHSFYPGTIKVTWYKENKLMPEKQDTEKVEQLDDLFYCTSIVKFKPSKTDTGKMFMCQIEHEGLMETKKVEFRMVQLISPPFVKSIECDPELPEVGKPLTLSCMVRDFFPAECNVMWVRGFERTEDGITTEDPELDTETGLYFRKSQRTFIPKDDDLGMEFTVELLHYNNTYRNTVNSYRMAFRGIPSVSDIVLDPKAPAYGQPLSLTCNVTSFAPKKIETVWKQGNKEIQKGVTCEGPKLADNGCFSLSSCLNMTPTALDFGKDFSFIVKHENLKRPIEKEAKLLLSAVPPTVSEIHLDPRYPEVNKKVLLKVSVTEFAPEDIKVSWFKAQIPIQHVAHLQTGDNGLLFMDTTVELIPKLSDSGAVIKCMVEHAETKERKGRECYLYLKGYPVLHEITSHPENVIPGEPVTLSCKLASFSSDKITVRWFKNDEVVSDGIQSILPKCENNGSYSLKSQLQFTPTAADRDAEFTIRAAHSDLPTPLERTHTLNLNSEDEMLQITCMPKKPKAGEEVQLRCFVKTQQPDETQVNWYTDLYPITAGKFHTEQCENGLGFYSCLTFQTSKDQKDLDIRCEVALEEETLEGYFTVLLS